MTEFKNKPIIIQGFPNNIEQAKLLDKMLYGIKRYVTGAIFLELEDEIVKSRMNEKYSGYDRTEFQREDNSVNTEINK